MNLTNVGIHVKKKKKKKRTCYADKIVSDHQNNKPC